MLLLLLRGGGRQTTLEQRQRRTVQRRKSYVSGLGGGGGCWEEEGARGLKEGRSRAEVGTAFRSNCASRSLKIFCAGGRVTCDVMSTAWK